MDSLRTGKSSKRAWGGIQQGVGKPGVRGLAALVLTHFHSVPLHLPSILLVHGPHVTIKEARGIGDHVSTAAVEKKRCRPVMRS